MGFKPLYMARPGTDTALALCDETLKHLMEEVAWLEVTPARKEHFMSDRPRAYAYKTFEGPRLYKSAPFTPQIESLLRVLNRAVSVQGIVGSFNVCFLNRYDDQRNHLGWHADDSPEMDHDHPIAVVSFGAEREIWWKPKDHKGEIPAEWRQKLGHGSMFFMPAGFQKHYLHRIPKCDRECGVRVSLTFRHYIDKETTNDPT